MNACTLKEPQQWKAGSTVKDGKDTPFYFDCADCGKKEPKIAGYLTSEGSDFWHIIIIEKPKPHSTGIHLALFCSECWTARRAAQVQP